MQTVNSKILTAFAVFTGANLWLSFFGWWKSVIAISSVEYAQVHIQFMQKRIDSMEKEQEATNTLISKRSYRIPVAAVNKKKLLFSLYKEKNKKIISKKMI